jgi:hypothetical protein
MFLLELACWFDTYYYTLKCEGWLWIENGRFFDHNHCKTRANKFKVKNDLLRNNR